MSGKRAWKKSSTWMCLFVLAVVIAISIWAIITQIQENHLMDDPMLHEIREGLTLVDPGTNSISMFKGDKSYTINKEKMFLCLRDKNGEYYDKNMLMYVAIHELAHVLNDSIGHTPQFHKKFQELLDIAVTKGVWDRSKPIIQDYCMYNG